MRYLCKAVVIQSSLAWEVRTRLVVLHCPSILCIWQAGDWPCRAHGGSAGQPEWRRTGWCCAEQKHWRDPEKRWLG